MSLNNVVKRKRKEAMIARNLAPLLQNIFKEQESLKDLFISRIELSKDGGLCIIYLSSFSNSDKSKPDIDTLKLFAPSTRKALANIVEGRYTPEIKFEYDQHLEKVRVLNEVLERVSSDLKKQDL